MEKGILFKFGTLAKAVSSKHWETLSLETMSAWSEWIVILTDNAEAYIDKINAVVEKTERPITCFVIDLHPCSNYKLLQRLWRNYVMTDKNSVETLLNFIYHHLVNPSRISFVLQDFRALSVPYPLIRAASAEIGKEMPFDNKVQGVCYGLCFMQDDDHATSYINALSDRIGMYGDGINVPWSIQFSADNVVEALFFYKPNFN